MIIPAKGKAIVPTDLSIALPPSTYGRVAPRSGLAVKHFIDVGAGVVDLDYRGPLGVVLFNFGEQDYKGMLASPLSTTDSNLVAHSCLVSRGDRIAQLVVERIAMPQVMEVDDLDDTSRGNISVLCHLSLICLFHHNLNLS